VEISTDCVIASTEGMPAWVSRAATLPIGSSPPIIADWQADNTTSPTFWRLSKSPSSSAET
jgi:hypothetical protein